MKYKDLLPSRIPEAFDDDNELSDYLETAGRLFDAFHETIESFDTYKDPISIPENRLKDLARRFAMDFPRNIDEGIQRRILRDLEAIYQKNGGADVINWIFNLIGWEVEIERAWVLNPEQYDPLVKEIFDLSDYGNAQEPPVISDFYRRDYRSFLLGEEYVLSNGTYFRGRKFFDSSTTYLNVEIVGESYDERTKIRTPDKVMATPYIFIKVSEETYNIFISPYVDEETGEVFEYTEMEFFKFVENVFNFFMLNANRPTNVRVVLIVTPQLLEDSAVIESSYNDRYTSAPVEIDDTAVMQATEKSTVIHLGEVGYNFIAGTPASPFSKDSVINPDSFKLFTGVDGEGEFSYVGESDFPYRIYRKSEQLGPVSGGYEWDYISPDGERFTFSRVILPEDTNDSFVDMTSFSYDEDLPSLSLGFDLLTSSYGVEQYEAKDPIIIRNSTAIKSYLFNPEERPADAFDIGEKIVDPETEEVSYDLNLIWSTDAREGGKSLQDDSSKTFWYLHDVTFWYKRNNLETTWEVLVDNPTEGSLNTITNANTVTPIFNEYVPYDFEFEVTYQPQPTREIV